MPELPPENYATNGPDSCSRGADMKHLPRTAVSASLLLTCVACSEPADTAAARVNVATSQNVTAATEDSVVVIQNDRSGEIGYNVLGAALATRIEWAPCVGADCPVIAPHESRRVPASQIGGWSESDEVIVYWWHVRENADGELYADAVRLIRLH